MPKQRRSKRDWDLEGQVEALCREIANAVGHVATPEGADALLSFHASETMNDAVEASDFAGDDFRIGILGLDDELHTFDWSCDGLGHRT